MNTFLKSVIFLGFVAITTQEIIKKKGCDCSRCKTVENSLNLVGSKKIQDQDKPGCNFCEQRREMIRMENEKQKQLQKCPFEILGAPALKGKTSEEIFDEFRELIVPSQNGFFDLMRGIVKTMHVSSETELKWALEKEAKALAKEKEEGKEEDFVVGNTLNQMAIHEGTIKGEEIPITPSYTSSSSRSSDSYRSSSPPSIKGFTEEANIVSQTQTTTETNMDLDYAT